MRYKILSNAYILKNHPRRKNVYLEPDLTNNERILQKELWLDMKRKISEVPNKYLVIRRNEVVISSTGNNN